jgi:hypothetical protein
MKNFNQTKYKLPQLWNDVKFTETSIDFLKRSDLNHSSVESFEVFLIERIEPNRVIYDLYDYKGITYTNNETDAVPVENFDVNEAHTAWTFKLPVYGYRIKKDIETLPNVSPYTWEYSTSIVIIKHRIIFKNLSDYYIKKSRIINYLFTDNNVPLPSFLILLNPISDIYTEFSSFYRWIKVSDGYNLEYYAIYPYTASPEVKLQLLIYFLNKDLGNESQSSKI